MTMHLDAYFSLSEGVKSSSSPIAKNINIKQYFLQISYPELVLDIISFSSATES